jgi:hypothetical protein
MDPGAIRGADRQRGTVLKGAQAAKFGVGGDPPGMGALEGQSAGRCPAGGERSQCPAQPTVDRERHREDPTGAPGACYANVGFSAAAAA